MVTSCTWLSRKLAAEMRMNSARARKSARVARTGIAHRRAQAADQLMQHAGHRALIGHLALHALGHELQRVPDVLLEVAVGRAARHGADRAHAAIGLVGAALIEKHLAGAFVGAGEQRAEHHAIGPGGERLGEIAGITRAAVGDHRDIALLRRFDRFEQRGELRHADPGHDARGADRPRPDADFDRVGAGIDQRLGAIRRRHVAGDDLHRIRLPLDAAHGVEHELGMAMRGVDHDQIGAGIDQPLGAHQPVTRPRWSPPPRASAPARPCRHWD